MNFDFATIMFIAAVITGGIWALDAVFWAPKRRLTTAGAGSSDGAGPDAAAAAEVITEQQGKEPVLVEYAKAFFPVIVIVLFLRSFLVEPFRIPSGSMMPTLLNGDFILVNKFAYGIRLPVINQKIIDVSLPERGDVIVFRYPEDPSIDYIKRVIGLPGDRIEYRDKVVYVNGRPLPQQVKGTYIGKGTAIGMTGASLREEKISEERVHDILIREERLARDGIYVVPEGHYFVMGDNRDNSNDSREWGTVPEEYLVGKAFLIWMNWDKVEKTILWDRIGSTIR